MSEPTSYLLLIPEKLRKKGNFLPLSGTINQDIKTLAHEHSKQLLEQIMRIQNATTIGLDSWIKYGGDKVRSTVTGGVETSERNQNQYKATIENIERALTDAYSQGKNTNEYTITLFNQESILDKAKAVTSIYATPDNVVELIERLKKTADNIEAKTTPYKQNIERTLPKIQSQEQTPEHQSIDYQLQTILMEQRQSIAAEMPSIKASAIRILSAINSSKPKRQRPVAQAVAGYNAAPYNESTPSNDEPTTTIGAGAPNTNSTSENTSTETKKSYLPMIGGFGFSKTSLDRIYSDNPPTVNGISNHKPNSVELSTGYIFIVPTDSGNKENDKKDKKNATSDPITAAQIENLQKELGRIEKVSQWKIILERDKEEIYIKGLRYGGDEGKFTRSGSSISWDGNEPTNIGTDNIARTLSSLHLKKATEKSKLDIYISSPETLQTELIGSFYVTPDNFDIFLKALHDTVNQVKSVKEVELEKIKVELGRIEWDIQNVDTNKEDKLARQIVETDKYLRKSLVRTNHAFKELLQRNMSNYFAGRDDLATDLISISTHQTEETPDKDTFLGMNAVGRAHDQAERLAKQFQRLRDLTNGDINFGYVGGREKSLGDIIFSDYNGDQETEIELEYRDKSGKVIKLPRINVTPINIEKSIKAVELTADEFQRSKAIAEKGNVAVKSDGITIHNVNVEDMGSIIPTTLKDKFNDIKNNPEKRTCNSCVY